MTSGTEQITAWASRTGPIRVLNFICPLDEGRTACFTQKKCANYRSLFDSVGYCRDSIPFTGLPSLRLHEHFTAKMAYIMRFNFKQRETELMKLGKKK